MVTTAITPLKNDCDVSDDPVELKRLLLEARATLAETEAENKRLIQEYWDNALNALVIKGLTAATFLAKADDGTILRCSDPTGLCMSEDDASGCIYGMVFDRLRDPRDYGRSTSQEITGVHTIPRMLGDELKDAVAKAMKSKEGAIVRPLRRTMQPIFSRKDEAILESLSRGGVDVMLVTSSGLDRDGVGWLHVGVIDVSALGRDDLTGVWRRKTLMNSLTRDIAECKRSQHATVPFTPVSVIIFDLDKFKIINDQISHYAGDQVLKAMARRAQRIFRRPTDLLGRYGGDEFAAKILGTEEEAGKMAEDLRTAICGKPIMVKVEPDSNHMVPLTVTISIGHATFPDGESAEALLDFADQGLQLSKQGGRNRVSTKIKALTRP